MCVCVWSGVYLRWKKPFGQVLVKTLISELTFSFPIFAVIGASWKQGVIFVNLPLFYLPESVCVKGRPAPLPCKDVETQTILFS